MRDLNPEELKASLTQLLKQASIGGTDKSGGKTASDQFQMLLAQESNSIKG